MDVVTVANSTLRDSRISFLYNKAMKDYGKTRINMIGCVFGHPGEMQLLTNEIPGKVIVLKTASSIEVSDGFSAAIRRGEGSVAIDSDLRELRR